MLRQQPELGRLFLAPPYVASERGDDSVTSRQAPVALKTPARSAAPRSGSHPHPPAARSRTQWRGQWNRPGSPAYKNHRRMCGSRVGRAGLQFGANRARHDVVVRSCRPSQRNPYAIAPRAAAPPPRAAQCGSTRPLRPTLHPNCASNSSGRVPFQNDLKQRSFRRRASPKRACGAASI